MKPGHGPSPSSIPGQERIGLANRLASLPSEKRALLAQRLAAQRDSNFGAQGIVRRTVDGPCPLASSQQRLWFLDQLEQGNPAYNVYRAVRMRGPLDRGLLVRCLSEIVRRHEILRSAFPAPDGRPMQVVLPAQVIPMPLIDLSGQPHEAREIEVARRAFAEAHASFNLATGPMLRATLMVLGEDHHVLLLTCHHIVADGWSVGLLFRELSILYEAFASGGPSPLAELPIQYGDYSIWQQSWLDGAEYREQVSYWKAQLSDPPPPLELPAARPRSALKSTRGERHFLRMPRAIWDEVSALARQIKATPYIGLLAGFKALLSRYTGRLDIAIGSPVAGRTQTETQGLIGCFSNTLVLRTRMTEDLTFRELMIRVREVALGAYTHQAMPFERLVRELNPQRDPSRMTFFQVNFRLLTTPRPPEWLGDVAMEFLEVDNRRAKFDLSVEFWEKPDHLAGYIEYYTDLYERSKIERMASDFERILSVALAAPDVPLSALDISPGIRTSASLPRTPVAGTRSSTMAKTLREAARRQVELPHPQGARTNESIQHTPAEPAKERYRLRQATLRDSEFLYRLRKQTMEVFVVQYPDWTEAHREAFYMDFEPAIHSIIVVDGEDVGAMAIRRTDHELYFANLHIFPQHAGKWLGTWIFRDVNAEADALGVPVRLHVMKNNPAIRLYQRMGYEVSNETEIRFEMTRPVGTSGKSSASGANGTPGEVSNAEQERSQSRKPGGLRSARRKPADLPARPGMGEEARVSTHGIEAEPVRSAVCNPAQDGADSRRHFENGRKSRVLH